MMFLSILRVHVERTTEPSEEMLQSVQARAAFVLEQLGSTARSATPELLVAIRQGTGNQRLAAALALAAAALPQSESIEMPEMMLNASPGMRIEVREPRRARGRRLFWHWAGGGPTCWTLGTRVSVVGLCVLSGDGSRAVRAPDQSVDAPGASAFRVSVLPLMATRMRGQVLPVLQAAQADVDASVRRNAVVLMGWYTLTTHPRSQQTVRACRDESGVVRRVALEVLWGILPNSDAAVDAALVGLNDGTMR